MKSWLKFGPEIGPLLDTILHTSAPWSRENHKNQIENWHRNRSPFGYGFRPHLDAAGEAFGLGFGPDWGRFWTPRRGPRD